MINAKLRILMFGTSLQQEYICLAKDKLSNQFRVFISSDNDFIDITNEHILLSYYPLLIGISDEKDKGLNDLLDNRSEVVFNFGGTTDHIIAQLI